MKTFKQSLTENGVTSGVMKKPERTGLVSAVPARVRTWGRMENPSRCGCESVCCDSREGTSAPALPEPCTCTVLALRFYLDLFKKTIKQGK